MENSNFIKTIMKQELENGVVDKILTRFPPEPNAYLHIGHARAIVTNFELAKEFNGATNLRFDDTNPVKEDTEYVDAIIKDLEWLGYNPRIVVYGSSYFEKTYEKAILFIKKGLAYVDDLSQEEVAEYRGSAGIPGKNSPYRNRSIEENLKLFEEMKDGKYANGEKTLRAKIDMSSPNINMRDPVIYRIIHINHHQTGDKWCIYPMYDFAHPLQDAFEGITHSLCSLEYEDHRPLYDWVINNAELDHKPRQIEFGRLVITNTIMSKRYLKQLVDEQLVTGYDDPRMPTLVGLKRRGFTSNAIKEFIKSTGLSKINDKGKTTYKDMFDLNCFCYALAQAKLPTKILDEIKMHCLGRYQKSSKLNDICKTVNLCVRITYEVKNGGIHKTKTKDIVYKIEGLDEGDILKPGESQMFTLSAKYNENAKEQKVLTNEITLILEYEK